MKKVYGIIRDHHARRTHGVTRVALDATLLPFTVCWRIGVFLRNVRWSLASQRRLPVPVVSVGGLAVGGSGKTEIAALVAGTLAKRGGRPGVVSRGYGRIGRGSRVVSVDDDATLCGDEPLMLARRLPDAVVVVDEDRVRGSKTAIEFGAGAIVLDDAFSHRRIARDLDVVVLHGADPFGGGRMMPRGPLREPVSSIRRVDLIWLHHADRMTDSVFVHARLKRIAPNAAVVSSVFRPTHIETSDGRASLNVLSGARVVALSGVGDPAGFSATFRGLGADVIAEFAFEDHHRHTARELRVVLETAGRERAAVVTTAKDAARMGTLPPSVTVLHGRAEVVEGVDVLNALLDRLVNSREGRDEA